MATAADIAAARRLIAQFEDRALGRHNSTFHRPSLEAQLAPEAPLDVRDRHAVPTLGAVPSPPVERHAVRMVEDYRQARVGECVVKPEWDRDFSGMGFVKYCPPCRGPVMWTGTFALDSMCTMDIWEFERVMLVNEAGEHRQVWKRIA